jgi:hypothetical protein
MTPSQKFNFFMPAWNAAVKANGWHTRGGAAAGYEGRVTCDEMGKVITFARQMWLARGWRSEDGSRMVEGPTLRDLRHACTVVCLGRDKDTDKLNNKEQDHIVALFKLLANPLSIAARTTFDAYQRGENPGGKVRQNYFIKSRAPEAVVRHLTMDLTGGRTRDPESLTDEEKHNLARLLAQRPVYGHRAKVSSPQSSVHSQPAATAAVAKPNPKHYVMKPELVYTKGPF